MNYLLCVICKLLYLQCLYNNNKLDLFASLSKLKCSIGMEYNICKRQNNEKKCTKYNFVYKNL